MYSCSIGCPNPEGRLVVLETGAARCAVLVLSGSSGRVEVDRIVCSADRGAAAWSIRWFVRLINTGDLQSAARDVRPFLAGWLRSAIIMLCSVSPKVAEAALHVWPALLNLLHFQLRTRDGIT